MLIEEKELKCCSFGDRCTNKEKKLKTELIYMSICPRVA